MFDDPQVLAEDLVASFSHPTLRACRSFTRAVTFGRTPGPQPFTAPTLGQHTDELLATLGRRAAR